MNKEERMKSTYAELEREVEGLKEDLIGYEKDLDEADERIKQLYEAIEDAIANLRVLEEVPLGDLLGEGGAINDLIDNLKGAL